MIPVKDEHGQARWIELDAVYYVETVGRQVVFHTNEGTFMLIDTLTDLCEILQQKGFERIDGKRIARVGEIDRIEKQNIFKNGRKYLVSEIVFKNGKKAKLSRDYRALIKNRLRIKE